MALLISGGGVVVPKPSGLISRAMDLFLSGCWFVFLSKTEQENGDERGECERGD
jgi:hypothetical protein